MAMDAARLFVRVSVAGADTTKRDLQSVGREVNAAQAKINQYQKNAGANLWKGSTSVAQGVTKIAALAVVAAAGAAVYGAKKWIAYDDALAGVAKTVTDLNAGQFKDFGENLKRLSTRIPVKFEDLAAIAQEAGALGVKGKDVAAFTETVARLSAATVGLTTDAAAEAFGKFGTIFDFNAKGKDPALEYQRMGSALIELGNNAASSESDIVAVTTRFAAAGQKAGLSIPEILGFSSAIASLGVEPEAAGGAMSRIFNKITTYIGTGDAKIKAFAKATGMSVKEFSDFFKRDASGAVQAFLTSLSGLDKFKTAAILKEGGLTNVRDVNVITLLSLRHAELAREIGISSDAYQKNEALMRVSETRFATLQNRLTMFKNLIGVAAASMASGFTPALGRLLVKATEFVNVHERDLVKIGQDIGTAIDGIDWSQVEEGAKGVATAVGKIFDVVSWLGPKIDLAIAGFVALNKVSGGAATQVVGGVLDMGKGVIGLAARLASRVPGGVGKAAGALGALTAQPVFVTNWPAGGLGGGGALGGLGEAAVGAAGLPLWFGALMVAIPAAVAVAGLKIRSDIEDQRSGLDKQTAGFAGTATDQQLKDSINGIRQTIAGMGEGLLSNFGNQKGIAVEQLNTLIAELNRRTTTGDHRYDPNVTPGGFDSRLGAGGVTANGFTADFRKSHITAGGFDDRMTASALAKIDAEFRKMLGLVKHANSPAAAIAAANAAVAMIVTSKRGGVAQTEAAIHDLKALLKRTTDPAAKGAISKALAQVEAKLPNRKHAQEQVERADRILTGTHTLGTKIAMLNDIERDLKDHKLPGQAAALQAKINHLRNVQKKAVDDSKTAIVTAIKQQPMSFTINPQPFIVNIDGRAIISATSGSSQFTRLPGDGTSEGHYP